MSAFWKGFWEVFEIVGPFVLATGSVVMAGLGKYDMAAWMIGLAIFCIVIRLTP